MRKPLSLNKIKKSVYSHKRHNHPVLIGLLLQPFPSRKMVHPKNHGSPTSACIHPSLQKNGILSHERCLPWIAKLAKARGFCNLIVQSSIVLNQIGCESFCFRKQDYHLATSVVSFQEWGENPLEIKNNPRVLSWRYVDCRLFKFSVNLIYSILQNWNKQMFSTSWFQSDLLFPNWRSLNHGKGHLT